MKDNQYIVRILTVLLLLLTAHLTPILAQTDTIRYVSTSGAYNNDGRSWATAKNRVQDAINDLYEYMNTYHLTSGSVYIAAGTYVPTESTESSGGSMLNTSFKIYSGIHVYGGFNPDTAFARLNEPTPGDRIMSNGKKCKDNWADPHGIGTTSGTEIASQWDFKHKTILSGNHASGIVSFTFDSIRGRYNTAYPASSFHVVWFATTNKVGDHYKPHENPASLDGCVISSGNASSRNTTTRDHTAYGGGVYMIPNSYLKNCIIERCNATLRGGGIYADGGGEIEFCFVHSCQSAGVGVVQGYGGGVCIDHGGSIGHSHITSCAARCGGGLMICHTDDDYPHMDIEALDTISYYNPHATACVINNNTANAEGGGIYLADGGTVNHCTVLANNCSGPDVTYYGRRHGRTGGIYVRNCGMIFNSVFWGNRCETNNDIQFATVRQQTNPAYEVFVYHSAFMNHDITDWTGVTKEAVYSLDKHNMPVEGGSGNFPCFFSPTVDPTDWNRFDTVGTNNIHGPGVFMHLKRLVDIPGPRIWHLTSYSALDQKGVQWNTSMQNVSYWLQYAHTDYGVVSNPYEPVSTLGALVRRPDPMMFALVAPQGVEGRIGGSDPIPTLFVDPNRRGQYDGEGVFVEPEYEGLSWNAPIKDLGEAISFFRQFLRDDDGENHHYRVPNYDLVDGKYVATGDSSNYGYIQILVKEGTLNTVGPGNYLDRNIRSASIRMESRMRLYGGYPSSLTGTNTEGRNPRSYRSIITANITGIGGEAGYNNNAGHVIVMGNAEHSIVDGFTLSDANTHNVYGSTTSAMAGGGVLINNLKTPADRRINMVGNQVRNCVITNCTSPKGAAVYVNGEYPKSDGEICYAELMLVNCIIRNNQADYTIHDAEVEDHGVVTANGRAYVHMEHCTVVNNVGFPFKADNKKTANDKEPISSFHGIIRVDNSLIYSNGDRTCADFTLLNDGKHHVTSVNKDGDEYVFGLYNMFDADLYLHVQDPLKPIGFFSNDYEVPIDTSIFLPRGVKSHFKEDLKDIPANSADRHNSCIFTRTLTDHNYPAFVNPSRNVGNAPDGDKPLYGGIVAYVPMTTNPCVNAAHHDAYLAYNEYDRSDVLKRDRGGAPDIGAVENSDLPAAGSVIYVTPDGAGLRDGSSWSNAIAGNTVYRLSSVPGPALATGDQIDPEATCDRVLDSEGNPILTTNSKYNGGWGRVWFTGITTGGSATTTVTKTWTTEKNVYDDGPNVGDEDIIQDDVYSESSETVNTPGSTPEGFVPGYDYDLRYPYGEISGASRTFWRANPYTGTAGSYNMNTFIAGCKANGWINNTRAERYVGGLQYAVEKASAYNKAHKDSIQVWVGAGTYTDYKGFVMRDSVTVYGGFPAGKYTAPAMSERQALMSAVVDIPKSLPAKDFEPSDYETILQISEVNPKSSNTALNTDAVQYWDDDYSYSEFTETTQFEYKSRTIVHHYKSSNTEVAGEDVQDTYMQYANMTGTKPAKCISVSNATYEGIDNGRHYYRFGNPEEPNGRDCWHMSYPDVDNYIANREDNNTYSNNCLKTICDTLTGNPLKEGGNNVTYTGNWIMIDNGSLTGLQIWQTLPDVPSGKYQLSIDMACQYKNLYNAPEDVNTHFYIINENNDTLVSTALKAPKYSNRDNSRKRAFRHVLSFNNISQGDITIKLIVGDGWRNTSTNYPGAEYSDYVTPTGVDPNSIPCLYVGQNGTCTETNKWGTKNPNARELWLSNIHIKPVTVTPGPYEEVGDPDDNTVDKEDVTPEEPVVSESNTYTLQTHRTTLRKRVLTMPDVCVPTFGGGGIGNPVTMDQNFGDNLAHTDRVKGDSKAKRTATTQTKQEDPHYVEYNEVNWDGFTIRHGFLYDESMAHGGGAGVNMYEGAHLRNCIVTNNFSGSRNMKGGGIFCDGATSTIEGCFVLNNTSTYGTYKDKQIQIFAGGMFMYEGTCFNSLFANNYSWGSAGGVGFCVGRFYNNTIAYNTCDLEEGGHKNGGAISIATSSNPNLFVANTIIYGNNGMAIRERYDQSIAMDKINPFINCYVQTEVAFTQDLYKKNIGNHSDNAANYGVSNVLLDGVDPSAANTPFAADFVNGVYTPGNASTMNDFQLRNHEKTDSSCVNHGTEALAGVFYDALFYKVNNDKKIKDMFIYKSVQAAKIPSNDVAFAKRVQDCQIDIGAYEFNAAFSIKPDTVTHPGRAIYYIAFDSPGGDASASSPANAACRQKLQLVLDAAGRYKHSLMTADLYNRGYTTVDDKDVPDEFVSEQPNKYWTVEVWLEGDNTNSTTSNDYGAFYTPTRSTKYSIENYHDNTLDYSFIIPHGIHVRGGYTGNFYHFENEDGKTVPAGTEGCHIVDERDPLTYRSVLSGKITSSTGAEGQCFHVVTFTNDLFRPDDEKWYEDNENKPIQNQLAALTSERDRAVVDGVFIEDGYANSPDSEDQIGAGAVVTDFAHIRNCVIQDNQAMEKGGGLYLKPNALVSGTIIKRNTAKVGGGIYVERPTDAQLARDSLARIFYSTICENTATASAGGMWFDNTYVRANSVAIWHNEANDNANVSGSFDRSDANTEYPFVCCAVESRRLEGQGNVELSPRETEGVRWDRQDPFNAILYYPIEMSSTLSRAGMTYREWDKFRETFQTLDSVDIAGVSRKRWYQDDHRTRGYAWDKDTLITKNNSLIEIGARALNKNFAIVVDAEHVMYRLYVMHTDLINSEAARALQDNTNDDAISKMYRQMGSCILNPFHRLSDAFDYVIAARKADPQKYRNVRFEIFVEQGTYYPFHNAYGEQGSVRMNTFLIPEAVLIVGGIDSRPDDHKYGQEGFRSPFGSLNSEDKTYEGIFIGNGSNVTIPGTGYTINYALTDSIRLRDDRHRPMRDNNLNSVIEPWELERQTILSGNAVSGEDFTHVYHVVTCHADEKYVGPRPYKFKDVNPNYGESGEPYLVNPILPDEEEKFHLENDLSVVARSIGFDGLQITGGYANHLDQADYNEHRYVSKTYFRGGGIFVDGNWDEDFETGDPAEIDIPNVTEPAAHNIPIVVENCFFTNNMAGNGGAICSNGGIYAYGNHFTQNYSQGPMTKLDQRFIPWTAGGCIATNAFCGVSNSLFDNNEARRGLYPITISGDEEIPYADARQGFGGCLSVATQSRMRVVNCHFMKNKAVGYSAIYNFTPNSHYLGDKDHPKSDSMQYAFNTIFWGNEVFDIESLTELNNAADADDWTDNDNKVLEQSAEVFNEKYKPSRAGVFHYDGDEWATYERLYHEYDSIYNYWVADQGAAVKGDNGEVLLRGPFNKAVTDKLKELRAQGDKMEGMFFCSYRKTYGPTGMKPNEDGFLLMPDEWANYVDPRKMNVRIKTVNRDTVENLDSLFTYVHGNNNTLINRINNATDGPNFKQPSFVAGIDGYMQNADWLLARMNLTTDQGWGHLKQSVARALSYYITKYTGKQQFDTAEEALAAAQAAHPGATKEDVYPVSGLPTATFKPKSEQPSPGAIYNFYARRYGQYMSDSNAPLPIGDQYYMSYTRSTSDEEESGSMDRISKQPKTGITDAFIDLGVYEYQYVQLDLKGQEIDTMWVATKTKDPIHHDGLTWETPTTDLQTAIDMLMSSHNDHDKYICFLGDDEGTFSPNNVLDNRRAFVITSSSLAPLLPDSAEADHDYGVGSLNFLGGYSFDVKDAPRDPLSHPVVVEMPYTGNANQLNQLFIIEDMTRQLVQVNWQGEYTSRDSVVIPVTFDGITFINPYSVKDSAAEEGGQMSKKGGAAIYYRWQRRYEDQGGVATPNMNFALHPDSALIDFSGTRRKVTLPKLTLSNCIFMDNGAYTSLHAERSPAVRIDHGGGSSLIVNTLFHSNAGAPVYARTFDEVEGENDLALVPNDVIIINSTSALNGGHIHLESDHSEVHNSLIWLDDLDNDTTIQLQLGADQWDKTTNKDRQGIAGRMTNNAVWGCFLPFVNLETGDPYNNHPLSTDNNDIYFGPGFFSPFVTATTSEQRRTRSFRLNPSLRTMNMADTTLYRNRVFFRVYPDTCAATHNKLWRRSNGFKSDYITDLVNDSDLAAKPRISGEGMERGAYECLAVLQRVLYVQPNLPSHSAGDGSSWKSPFGQGQLQNAIDAAAVYTYLNRNQDLETRKAYVFVKGSLGSEDRTTITARDGVFVYGSLPNSFNDTAWIDPEQKKFTNDECQRYINYVRALSSGLVSPASTNAKMRTRINSVQITGDDFLTGFLLDGFLITNPDGRHSAAPVYIDNEKSAIRNCLITDNTITDAPVADIRRGLVYNCLFYNDSASSIVRIGADGLSLNNTIVADNEDVTPLLNEATADAVQNTLYGQRADLHCFAPYLTDYTPYTLPAYLTANQALSYQLHEHSSRINAGVSDTSLPAVFDDYVSDSTIAFRHDRDLLGNPRKIGSQVDIGAFETWRIEPKTVVELTALTNRETHLQTIPARKKYAFLTHYGGNFYPHPGSVCYLMDSSAVTLQYSDPYDFRDFNDDAIILSPGYVLLKRGASFYGNGHELKFAYLAAERPFHLQRYAMTAFPFSYSTDNITVSTYAAAGDTLTYNLSPFTFTTYRYNGVARSAKDYVFQTDNSTLWTPIDTVNRTATEGYLIDFGSSSVDTVLRFTSFASAAGQYVYTESDHDKTVFLTQYDNRTAGSGASLNFTRQEDMGWNMKGLPWLVSNYRTDTTLYEDNFLRQMFIPHVMYLMNADGTYLKDEQIYAVRSWDKGSMLSLGNAFLTQTATKNSREGVIFHLPYYGHNEKASRPILRLANARGEGDVLTAIPDSAADKNVRYSYGRDGLKWSTLTEHPEIYLMDQQRTSRLSLLGATPIEVDIPLGVSIPEKLPSTIGPESKMYVSSPNAQMEKDFTFSLPEKEAYMDYGYVWLIDYDRNRYTNLLSEDYTVSLSPGEHLTRFAIRIGGYPLTDEKGNRRYIVYQYDGTLYVRGLIPGDYIALYTSTGQLVCRATATSTEFTYPLPYQSGYVVRVNRTAHKVLYH